MSNKHNKSLKSKPFKESSVKLGNLVQRRAYKQLINNPTADGDNFET